MRLPSNTILCGLVADTLQTIAVSNAGAQAKSDDDASKLSVPFDSENTNSLKSRVRHTPSGQPYLIPPPDQPEKPFFGTVEVGISASSGDNNNYCEYRDPRNEPAIANFDFSVEH